MAHRDYDVKVRGREYRLRVREGGENVFLIELGGRRLEARVSGSPAEGDFRISLGGREYPVRIRSSGSNMEVQVSGHVFLVDLSPVRPVRTAERPGSAGLRPAALPATARQRAAHVKGAITSPIPGKVVALKVREGDSVRKGDVLLVIEAMKMENEIRAPRDGRVKEVLVQEGSAVSVGQPLLVLD